MSNLLKKIKTTKRDYSDYLYHFTRHKKVYGNTSDIFSNEVIAEHSSLEVLKQILISGKLMGNAGYSPEKCICFTETPIDELIWLMSQEEWDHDNRYSFHGLAVKKTWLYSKGGRPVIYQHGNEKNSLGTDQVYRHNRYEPSNDIDWSWEREWRVKADELTLDATATIVICELAFEAKEIMTTQFSGKNWLATSIELLRR